MSEQRERSKSDFGYFVVICSFVLGFVVWCAAPSIGGLLWLLLMGVSTFGMWKIIEPIHRELNEFKAEKRKQQTHSMHEMEQLEACLSREDRRKKIQKGLMEDDGLSEYGRAIRADAELAARIKRDEEMFGSEFPDQLEDLPALAAYDTAVISTWKRKVKAEDAWKKITQ